MKKKLFLILCLISFLLIIIFFKPFKNTENNGLKIQDLKDFPKLQIADLIFRQGIGADSLIIQQLSQSPFYHIGIIVKTSPIMILHASADYEDKDLNKVEIISLEDFLKLSKNIAIKKIKFDPRTKRRTC